MPTKQSSPTVTIERLDIEAFHRDLALMRKWCLRSYHEVLAVTGGKDHTPTFRLLLCGLATWSGRLSAALRWPDGHYPDGRPVAPLRTLASDLQGWESEEEIEEMAASWMAAG